MKTERTVVVTGSGGGIGRCISRYFAEKGWLVCIADLSLKRARETVEEISNLCPKALAAELDIRRAQEVQKTIRRCIEEFGRLDAWVNNAGVTDKQHRVILHVPYEVWSEILSVNLFGTFVCVKECAALMKEQGYGNIVNVTSLLGQRTHISVGNAAYGVSKAAVEALTEYAAGELEGTGVNVNAAYPGAMVNTGFFDYLEKSEREKLERPTILNELVYVLCCLKPGELSGKSFSYQNWKQNPKLQKLIPQYLHQEQE